MRIRRPKSLTGNQIIFATILGFFGGLYIWKPVFVRFQAKQLPSTAEKPGEH